MDDTEQDRRDDYAAEAASDRLGDLWEEKRRAYDGDYEAYLEGCSEEGISPETFEEYVAAAEEAAEQDRLIISDYYGDLGIGRLA